METAAVRCREKQGNLIYLAHFQHEAIQDALHDSVVKKSNA